MTDAASPNPVSTDAAISAILDNPRRLGLTWNLTPGTVTNSDPLKVMCDGDTVAISMVSTVGALAQGQRVFVLQVPPSGNFVLGAPGDVTPGQFQDRQTLTATQPVVTFTVPSTLRYLQVIFKARVSGAVTVDALRFNINSDGGAAYVSQFTRSNNVTVSASNAVTTSGIIGLVTGATATANWYGGGNAIFEGWDRTGQLLSWDYNSTGLATVAAGNFFHDVGGGVYTGLAARTTIAFSCSSGSFISGSDFQVYGAYA